MRYIAYRGEYGLTDQVLSTRLGSYTFSTQEAAQRYALHPNDARYRDWPTNPRLICAELQIANPVTVSLDDPFIEFSDIRTCIGTHAALAIARWHSSWIQSTDHWLQTYANDYTDVEALLRRNPGALEDLYCQAYPIFDDPRCVALFAQQGYDGAIHGGNAEFSEHVEFRVFSLDQISVLNVYSVRPPPELSVRPCG